MGILGTDLALEAAQLQGTPVTSCPGLTVTQSIRQGYPVTRMDLQAGEHARRLERPPGTYITITLEPYLRRQPHFFARGAQCIAAELSSLLPPDKGKQPVLVAAIGNPSLTADAIGPEAVSNLLVTRHMLSSMPRLFGDFHSVAAVSAGVLSQTGMESAEMITAVSRRLHPRAVIVVDALAARSREKLCRVLQLADTGLTPGSGVGNHRRAITRETLGVPVLAVGLPTVIRAETLCSRSEPAGPADPADALFVTPRDIDQKVRELGRLIGYGITLALQPNLTVEDVTGLLG